MKNLNTTINGAFLFTISIVALMIYGLMEGKIDDTVGAVVIVVAMILGFSSLKGSE